MMNKMNREQIEKIVADARAKGARPDLSGLDLSDLDLFGIDLRGADLTRTNLRGSNLRSADLACTNMSGADMRGANLRNAVLLYANLNRADMTCANLSDAFLEGSDLRDAVLPGLLLDGLPAGRLIFIPTSEGWRLAINCWEGTTDNLRERMDEEEGFAMHRPTLSVAVDMCDAFAAAQPDAVAEVRAAAEKWEVM